MFAFRCKNCGKLHAAEHAGQNQKPHSCCMCGKGVSFDERGNKTFDKDNWEVLDECDPERLAELGLGRSQVVAHTPLGVEENLARATATRDALVAKRDSWKANRAKHIATMSEHTKKRDKLHKVNVQALDPAEAAKVQHDKQTVDQQMKDLVGLEWTQRDEQHLKEVEECITLNGHTPRTIPRHIEVSAFEGLGSDNSAHKDQ